MKSFNALRLVSLAGLGFLVAASASAQEASYFFGGLSIAHSQAKIDEDRITANLLAAGLTTTAMTSDGRDTAYKLVVISSTATSGLRPATSTSAGSASNRPRCRPERSTARSSCKA